MDPVKKILGETFFDVSKAIPKDIYENDEWWFGIGNKKYKSSKGKIKTLDELRDL